MVVTTNFELPTEEELTVPEILVSYPLLQAASFYIGKKCEWIYNEFSLCKQETKDPRQCLDAGKNLTACALEVFQDMKKHCATEITDYANCLQQSSSRVDLYYCRKTQAVADSCVLKNLNIERPPFGYFCEAKVHHTSRPKPVEKELVFPDGSAISTKAYHQSKYPYRRYMF